MRSRKTLVLITSATAILVQGCGGAFVNYRLSGFDPAHLSPRDSVQVVIYDREQTARKTYYLLKQDGGDFFVKLDEKDLKERFGVDRVDSLQVKVKTIKNPEVLFRHPDGKFTWESVTAEDYDRVCDKVSQRENLGCPVARRAAVVLSTGEPKIYTRSKAELNLAKKGSLRLDYAPSDSAAVKCDCDGPVPPPPPRP